MNGPYGNLNDDQERQLRLAMGDEWVDAMKELNDRVQQSLREIEANLENTGINDGELFVNKTRRSGMDRFAKYPNPEKFVPPAVITELHHILRRYDIDWSRL